MSNPKGDSVPTDRSQRYFAGETQQDAERIRLSALEDLFDRPTFEKLSQLGVTEGWRCLERLGTKVLRGWNRFAGADDPPPRKK